jgi:predicted heme/steroid binding protein
MDEQELRTRDGRDGRAAYVAFNGKVYDVSQSALWSGGIHMGRHHAGMDLTSLLPLAPHGEEVFERVAAAGELEKRASLPAEQTLERFRKLYAAYHPHPLSIHFPMGVFSFSALMQALFLLTGIRSLEVSAFYALMFAALTTPPAMVAGLFSWWVNYEMALTSIFRNKLIFSVVALTLSLAALIIRLVNPDMAAQGGGALWAYSAVVFAIIPSIFFVAYNGGKITWPS